MSETLVVLAQFATPEDLHVVKSALDAAGIHTATHDENAVGSLWHAGIALGGVKLLVKDSDVPRAREIMQEQATHAPDKDVVPAWTCNSCGEDIDSGFAVCWSCGTAHDSAGRIPVESDCSLSVDESDSAEDQLPLSRHVAKEMLSGYLFIAYGFCAVMFLLLLIANYRFGAFVFVLAALFFGVRKLVSSSD